MVSGLAIAHASLTLMLQGRLMVDSTGFRSSGNENAALTIQSVGVEGPTCRTEERGSPETAKCVSERPTLVSAKCAEKILVSRNQNMGER
jgi:hypothetical protein